jgi:hypothetical protein
MFFESWYALLRIVVVGLCAYVALVGILRVSGKRTLSKWNAHRISPDFPLNS